MNNLNSVLIEGNVTVVPIRENEVDGKLSKEVLFVISLQRFYKSESEAEYIQEITNVLVIVGGRQGEVCEQQIKLGNQVRVIGRLMNRNDRLAISAEHVEFVLPTESGEKKQL